MSILKSSLVVSLWTFASRISGFVRDMVIAGKLGTGGAADAFFVALTLPNLLRRLFAEGAFNVSFVPIFSRIHEGDGADASSKFASLIFVILMLSLSLITVLAWMFMPWIIGTIIAPGMKNQPDVMEMTVFLGRITFPYIIFISAASLIGSMCNTIGRFSAYASMPILFNVALISTLVTLPYGGINPALAGAIGLPIAGIMQFGYMAYALKKTPLRLHKPESRTHKELKPFFRRLGPAAMAVGILQLSFIIDMHLASYLGESAISYLNYANRFYQLPLSLIGVAMATVLLPHFSRALKREDWEEIRTTFFNALIFGLMLGSAAMVGLLFLAFDLMGTLFGHGAFGDESVRQSALAMMGYSIGLPAFILSKVTLTAFYASEDTKTPFYISIFILICNVILNLILMQHLAHVGIALATGICGWLNAGVQIYLLRRKKRVPLMPVSTLIPGLAKSVFPAIIMAIFLFGFSIIIPAAESKLIAVIRLFSVITLACGVFVATVFMTKLATPADVRAALSRKRS
ncbi:MAG: murein biosynthesis integral membrane protein MurJ [Pseudomonadota bacterium]|nr:murein biosynthesis integral membrane protein MurJ [Pseudomonadota bacterium]